MDNNYRIEELESLVTCQDGQIGDLETELEALRQDFKTLLYALEEQTINTDIL